ncbi:MAG TPA: hypothetical protein VHM25_25415, partial [Polyangiaceae bacterium]|nr:hypothetical protein [Polyangiaceae bacterium]
FTRADRASREGPALPPERTALHPKAPRFHPTAPRITAHHRVSPLSPRFPNAAFAAFAAFAAHHRLRRFRGAHRRIAARAPQPAVLVLPRSASGRRGAPPNTTASLELRRQAPLSPPHTPRAAEGYAVLPRSA